MKPPSAPAKKWEPVFRVVVVTVVVVVVLLLLVVVVVGVRVGQVVM